MERNLYESQTCQQQVQEQMGAGFIRMHITPVLMATASPITSQEQATLWFPRRGADECEGVFDVSFVWVREEYS